jgi:hypothetical protein
MADFLDDPDSPLLKRGDDVRSFIHPFLLWQPGLITAEVKFLSRAFAVPAPFVEVVSGGRCSGGIE